MVRCLRQTYPHLTFAHSSSQFQSKGQIIIEGTLGNLGILGNEKGEEGNGIANLILGIFALIPSGTLGSEGRLGILGIENGEEGMGIANFKAGGLADIPGISGCLGILGNLGNEGTENGEAGKGIANLGIIGDGSLHLLILKTLLYSIPYP